MAITARGTPRWWFDVAWTQLKEFCAIRGDATFVWTRWLILRSVGVLFIIMFQGVIEQSRALIGPDGIAPVGEILAEYSRQFPNPIMAFLRAPGLLWLNSDWGMIATLQWLGMAAAVALTFNLWPRMAAFACWLIYLSFTSSGPFFAQMQPDPLMLEVALLCIALAPTGYRPGLAAQAAPRPIVVFALRYMLFRLMLEAGLAKFVFGGQLWNSLTAMDVMYETAPFPTFLGFLLHQLPHWFHVLEIGVTFIAEGPAPIVMIFGGRRWRWFAFWIWTFFQLGIQFSNNFAWLNVGAIGLALILLDDHMLTSAARRLRLRQVADFMQRQIAVLAPTRPKPWALHGLRVALGVHAMAATYFYVVSPTRIPPQSVPAVIARPMGVFTYFHSANAYALFGNLPAERFEVEFQGSNDSGETWRSFEFRYKIQRTDRVAPFIAPWYPRFDAILQNVRVAKTTPELYASTAAHLILRDAPVMNLFASDPFPERPPTMIRLAEYQYHFNGLATWRATGQYWRKEYLGDWLPTVYRNARGEIVVDE